MKKVELKKEVDLKKANAKSFWSEFKDFAMKGNVVDLAIGHVMALDKMSKGVNIYNLGTGNGYSVLEIIHTFENVNKVKINYQIVDRRSGDIAECYADSSKAYKELGWKAKLDLSDMVSSAYNYAQTKK